MAKQCPSCGIQNEDSAAFCDNCGATLGAHAGNAGAPVAAPQAAPVAGGSACPQCGTPNMLGTMFCDNCGASLAPVAPTPTNAPAAPVYTPPPAPAAPAFTPAASALPPTPPRLTINNQTINTPPKTELVIGRADLASGWNPDVDLAPHGGTPEAGVSRKHARLVWQGTWMLEDLNSTNGTYLRGQRLAANAKTPINTGEMFQVGRLQIVFYT